jgi:type I restriction enzyme M protein
MQFAERFHTFMPESGKKADLMFVQHMVASLKSDGRMAVVMPHGVLFRGGEEKACRQKFIKDGNLEAVIGLPAGLFYGTGIPACVLVINKNDSAKRTSVLFINADREYKEGKNQNSLRPTFITNVSACRNTPVKCRSRNWSGRNSISTYVATSITARHRNRTTCGHTCTAAFPSARSPC